MIYIYHAQGTDLYKIGYTKRDAETRRREWETGCPFPLALVGTLPGSIDDERRLHRKLKRRGRWVEEAAGQEWFRLSSADLEELLNTTAGRGRRTTKVEELAFDLGEKIFKRKLNNISRRKGLQGIAASALKKFLKGR